MEKLTIKTVLRVYSFDVRTPEGKAGWDELQAKLKGYPHKHGPVLSNVYFSFQKLDGATIELETKHLFENQWNTAPVEGISDKGLRVFDWALEAERPNSNANYDGGGAPLGIRRGHYLEQTPDMKEIRRNTCKCGYCGKQEPSAKGYVFCPHCLDSEYLKPEDLKLLRMRPIDTPFDSKLPDLSGAEKAHLLPLYHDAQLNGAGEKGKARIAKVRQDIATEYAKTVANAEQKRDAALWVMDNVPGLIGNWIYYSHTQKHSFGWRKPLEGDTLAGLLNKVSEFPFDYEIKCADGRTLG